jgi:hypothetical protein
MIQIVYVSAAVLPFSNQELTSLLTRSRRRNSLYSVTGMLVYHEGSFLQVLEGPENGVSTIFKSIERDPRHRSTRMLLEHSIKMRDFDQWSMAFPDLRRSFSPAGFVDFHHTLPNLVDAGNRTSRLLRSFRDGLYRQAL